MTQQTENPWYLQRTHFITAFFLHCATGVLAVVVHYGLMYLALGLALSPVVSTSIGFAGGALTRFLMAYFHIFTPSSALPVAVVKFLATLLLQFFANAALLAALVGWGLSVWPAQIATTISLTAANYLIYRYWVFK
jgi:putative flippase GtrA